MNTVKSGAAKQTQKPAHEDQFTIRDRTNLIGAIADEFAHLVDVVFRDLVRDEGEGKIKK